MQTLRLFKVLEVSIHLYCGSHVGGQENVHKPIFQYNIIENAPTSDLVQRHVLWSYTNRSKFAKSCFDDVISKPPIETIYFYLWHSIKLQQIKTSTQLSAIPYIFYWDLPWRPLTWLLCVVEISQNQEFLYEKNGLLTFTIP